MQDNWLEVVLSVLIAGAIFNIFLMRTGYGISSLASGLLFLLVISSIRPGLVGESLGAIGLLVSFRVLKLAISKQSAITPLLFGPPLVLTAAMLWQFLRSPEQQIAPLLLAVAVANAAYYFGLGLGVTENGVHGVFKAMHVFLLWQLTAYLASITFPQVFPFRVNSFFDGRGWTYLSNSLGAIVAGEGDLLSQPLFGFASGGMRFPRLTGLFGEPAILAIFATFYVVLALSLKASRRLTSIFIGTLVVVATQSLTGFIILFFATAAFFLGNSTTAKSIAVRWRALATTVLVLLFAFSMSAASTWLTDKFSGASGTDRLAFTDASAYIEFWIRNPFGSTTVLDQAGINLLKLSVQAGFPVLFLGLLFYLWLPWRLTKGKTVVPFLVVLSAAVIFAEPPFLPLWPLLLGFAAAFSAQRNLLGKDVGLQVESGSERFN